MRAILLLTVLSGLTLAPRNAATAPSPPDNKLPEGIVRVDLPDEPVAFLSVKGEQGSVVQVKTKSFTLTAPRVFIYDRDCVVEFTAEGGSLKWTNPQRESGFFSPGLVLGGTDPKGTLGKIKVAKSVEKGSLVVDPSPDGGLRHINRGDVVLTHPGIRVRMREKKTDGGLTIQVEGSK